MDPVNFVTKVPFHRFFAFVVLQCLVKDLLGEVDIEALGCSYHSTGLLSYWLSIG